MPSQSAQSQMHELAKTLPPPRKQNTACDACRSGGPRFVSHSTHHPLPQLSGHERSSAIESPATIKLVVDFRSPSSRTSYAQLPTQVPGRLPARSIFCEKLVNPRSVHQHCLSKNYPCTLVSPSCPLPLNRNLTPVKKLCPAGDGKKAVPKTEITERVNDWVTQTLYSSFFRSSDPKPSRAFPHLR